MTTVTKTRKPQPRKASVPIIGAVRIFWLTAGKLTTTYRRERIQSQLGGAAFRLSKAN